ncbi:hypothetical protein CRENBAI_001889 [Crenichthys baileyi]|uniref:Uncharacterized protein n=1 Tax=Crenichthys baileyi TaxID=28760 RepID=A0AAV9QPR1_9TELE
MLRHCPIPRFSSSGARTKMPNAAPGKEKALHNPKKSQTLDLADPKDIATKSIPPQKVLKIFSINIIAQGLPFCRRRGLLSVAPPTADDGQLKERTQPEGLFLGYF